MLTAIIERPGYRNLLGRSNLISVSVVFLAYFVKHAAAQAPINDLISWPPGLLLLATVLYASLGKTADQLWPIEPSVGVFLADGLPHIALPLAHEIDWEPSACHFIPRVRRATGFSNVWLPADKILAPAREEALAKCLAALPCIWHGDPGIVDWGRWRATTHGLVYPLQPLPSAEPALVTERLPTAEELLLFAAIGYHLNEPGQVDIKEGGSLIFSTAGMRSDAIIDVDNEDAALVVVVSYMLRRPAFERHLKYTTLDGEDHVEVQVEDLVLDAPAFGIDFGSFASFDAILKPSLRELVAAYLQVLCYIRSRRSLPATLPTGHITYFHYKRTLWAAILGGALLDSGRLTIQNIPFMQPNMLDSINEVYLSRVEEVLRQLDPIATDSNAFNELSFGGGLQRVSAWPFFLAGLAGQASICYFLSIGTTAGVWTTVALSNSLLGGLLTDLHSRWCGRRANSQQPGVKLYVPGSKQIMCIATLNRSPPAHEKLRPGALLNVVGIVAASLGAVFQQSTRLALGFGKAQLAPPWVMYTAVVLGLTISIVVVSITWGEMNAHKSWCRPQSRPEQLLVGSTVCASIVVSGIAVFFQLRGLNRLWPILDMLTFVSGIPLGM
ncbi:hypothetical protein BKA62DRAFT_696051, partial [Auriculariales sp. MPI-PUGE-AT-0066]